MSETKHTPPRVRFQVPVGNPRSNFVGREQEMTDVKQLLSQTRLLTLSGVGGVGKTRLAMRVAADVADDFRDGVCWVELAALNDTALVPQAMATAIGLREAPHQSLADAVAHALQAKHLLLVLDNCEHLLSAVTPLSEQLLQAAPDLRILATSRQPLDVSGETAWLVPSLALPPVASDVQSRQSPVEDIRRFDAVQLFLARASAILPEFTLTPQNAEAVAQVCRRLDGLPLAIELAAARVKVLTAEQIVSRLDDRFALLTGGNRLALIPRHQTLRATLDWSYDLLSADEQCLFRRLAVFAGGWTLEAAEAVTSERSTVNSEQLPLSTVHRLRFTDVLDLLDSLVDKSLVVAHTLERSEARYHLLETTRQYALEKLKASGEFELLRARHLDWYLALAERAAPELMGAQQSAWLVRLAEELDNMRAALQWALAEDDARSDISKSSEPSHEKALRLSVALWKFWRYRGYLSEGFDWSVRALKADQFSPRPAALAVRASATWGAGMLAAVMRQDVQATAHLEQSLQLWTAAQNPTGIAGALTALGARAAERGAIDQAITLQKKALALYEQQGLLSGMTYAHNALGESFRAKGDYAASREHYEASLNISKQIGHGRGVAVAMSNLAQIEIAQRDLPAARAHLAESLQIFLSINDPINLASCLMGLGCAAVLGHKPSDLQSAAWLFGFAQRWLQESGGRFETADQMEFERHVEACRVALGDAAFTAAQARGRALTLDAAIACAREVVAAPLATAALRITAFGEARVQRGDHLLTSADWKYAKAKELCFYLLCHGPATKEQIGLALWPDASPAQLRAEFHRTLHHLRRALGRSDWVVRDGERYAFNRTLAHWFDVEAFEQHIADSQLQIAENNERASAVSHPSTALHPVPALRAERGATALHRTWTSLQSAIGLYRGDLLADMRVGDWVTLRREALGKLYLDALLQLGQLLVAEGREAEAATVYQRAIAHDNYLEAAHREFMRCLARQGERNQALRHYELLTKLLRDELGVAPAPETSALHERLRRGEQV